MNQKHESRIKVSVRLLFGLGFFSLLLAACVSTVDPERVQAARESVSAVLSHIEDPPDGAEVLRIYSEDFDDGEHREWGDRPCAYSRRYVVVGSTESLDDVVLAYVALLEEAGFDRKGMQFAHGASLYSGSRTSVHMSELGRVSFIDPEDEERWRSRYPVLAMLNITAIVPDAFECEAWGPNELMAPYAVPTVTPRAG